MLVDVVVFVGEGQHLALVDVIDSDRFEDLRLHEMTDPGLGHHRNRNGLLDVLNHLGIAHPSDASLSANIGGNALQSHDGASTGFLRDAGLLGVDDVHDNAAAEHLSQTDLNGEGRFLSLRYRTVTVNRHDA
ncbi:hypothetical protein YC2023_026272 [Brassica napus]